MHAIRVSPNSAAHACVGRASVSLHSHMCKRVSLKLFEILPLQLPHCLAMSRQAYTSQRMRAVATRSVADYLSCHTEGSTASLGDVSCEYEGVAQPDGSYDLDGSVRKRSTVAFRWRTNFDGPQNTVVETRADNAIERGIAIPPPWHFAPMCCNLQAEADKTATKAGQQLGLTDVSCRVLGQPRRSPLPDTD